MPVRRLKLAAVVSTVAMTFALGACGGGSGDSEQAPKPGALSKDNFVSKVAAAQREAGTGSIKMTIDASKQKNVAAGAFRTGATAQDAAVGLKIDARSSGLGILDLRLVEGALYMNFGEMTGNKFSKLPLDGSGDAATRQLTRLIDQVDPSAQIKQFETALKSLEQNGDAVTIDDVKTLPYKIVLDTAKMDGMAKLAKEAGEKLPATLTYTMFVGPDDLPRRVEAKVVGMSFVLDYKRWGQKVRIQVPEANQISAKPVGGA